MKTIALISGDKDLQETIRGRFDTRYQVLLVENINFLFDFCITSTPDIMVVDADFLRSDQAAVISTIKSDPLFGALPILAVVSDIERLHNLPLQFLIDDYILSPYAMEDLDFRIKICISRAQKVLETNPLTRLPGNITIIKEIEKRIAGGEVFALAYADIDSFKPFNDHYGFSRGDEVIRVTGRIVGNVIKMICPDNGFAGHVGGDDFVFIAPFDKIEAICTAVLTNFDEIIPSFYDIGERKKGYIESIDREGNKRSFPIMSLSIGVSHNKFKSFSHYGHVSEIATEMKKYAKTFHGSCFKIDGRRG